MKVAVLLCALVAFCAAVPMQYQIPKHYPGPVSSQADMKIPALAEKLGLKTLVKLLGDADLVDALNGDGESFTCFVLQGSLGLLIF